MMDRSARRMSAIINNVLDFARGRLGGGLPLNRSFMLLEPVLAQVIGELQTTHPERTIVSDFKLDRPVYADPIRVGQLFSNLLGNALAYGTTDKPVGVRVTMEGRFEISVTNKGPPIPAAAMDRLFLPFSRGSVRPDQQGLGLGLYIASEIARAHGGKIDATSSDDETRFTFSMPLDL
jgi:sigma-B regulation protein RsbU (phosphoserine phosphatase)